ncbi:tripartite tricarboxylate transporter substrate binding protein [Hydrogenophaga sp.]|uniref:Bug family tripartite tricarboxylate transporter substrate binding protein n=1 Tax=Hydrogenophaga sp. TaxID=1904254 RepID=UPI00271C6267|nr:tripartite tricarboxylate transporter substrate-binding protein [Hydrogenophaga sp.]MDO9437904.1 tripartite tricarboxylate transporter substrate-binding protein [Hydrogenophaga sp.]
MNNLVCIAARAGLAITLWTAPFLTGVHAQTYPDRPVRVIIGTAPGGAVDIVGRMVMNKLSDASDQPFVIENIPGPYAGLKKMVDAPADGYTVMLQSSTMTVTKALFPNMPFDPARVSPVAQIADSALILVARKGLGKSVDEVVKQAKARPGALTYGSAGHGSPPNLAGELFKFSTGIDLLHIPFKGVAPALTEVVAGRVDLMFTSYASALPFLQSGKVDALAVTTAARARQAPQLPTLVELGYKDMVTSTWVGLIAPYGTPAPAIARLNAMIAKVMAEPGHVSQLLEQGFEARASTPAEFGSIISADTEKNARIVQRAGVKPE